MSVCMMYSDRGHMMDIAIVNDVINILITQDDPNICSAINNIAQGISSKVVMTLTTMIVCQEFQDIKYQLLQSNPVLEGSTFFSQQ